MADAPDGDVATPSVVNEPRDGETDYLESAQGARRPSASSGRWNTLRVVTDSRSLALLLAVAGASVAIVWLLTAMSAHAFTGNSDGATVVLEGQSISAGHILLSGWGLSRDSFWTIDALAYGLVISIVGLHKDLLHVVPALIMFGAIAVGSLLSIERRRGAALLAGPLVLLVLIGLPSPDLAFFSLQGPWHVGTALVVLIAILALSRGGFGWRWAVAIFVLAAGVLGDYETLAYGVAPVLLAGLVEMRRVRSVRAGLPTTIAAPLTVIVAVAVRALARVFGTFSIATGVTHALPGRVGINLVHAFTWGSGLLGVRVVKIGPAPVLSADDLTNGSGISHLLHVPGVALVAAGLVLSVAGLVRGLFASKRGETGPSPSPSWRVDDLLIFATAGSVVSYVILCPNNNGDYGRYLTAGVIFAAVLAARWYGRFASWCAMRSMQFAPLGLVLLLGIGIGFTVSANLASHPAVEPPEALEAFLQNHHLTEGIGDYWSSSIVTVETAGRVTVRPVITDLVTGKLARYERQSDAAWYSGHRFQFLVFDRAHPWRTVNATTASVTFGAPNTSYSVGTYEVLVWAHPLVVSPIGYTRG